MTAGVSLSLAGPLVATGTQASASVTALPLQQVKVVAYWPSTGPWTNMWTNFQPSEISADFAKLAGIGANTVRLILEPTEFGMPTLKPQMISEFNQVVSLAESNGLHVQLTLFDWFSNYTDVSDSKTWVTSFLAPLKSNPEISFVELQNEINPYNPTALAWARAVLPVAKSAAGSIPVTISTPGADGIGGLTTLKANLGTSQPDFFDYHFYGAAPDAYATIEAAKAAVAPAQLIVGETGKSTYTSNGTATPDALAAQATYLEEVEAAAQQAGVGTAGIFTMNDTVGADVPPPAADTPSQWNFGIYESTGAAKPAATVVQQAFTGATLPALYNSDFTDSVSGIPIGWSTSGSGNATLTSDAAVSQNGSPSVEISGATTMAAWYQVVNAGPMSTGYRLQATAWMKGVNVTGNNNVVIAWFNAYGAFLSNTLSAPLPQGDSNWTQVGVNSAAPSGAAYAMVYLQASGDSGSVFFSTAAVTLVGNNAAPALPIVPATSGVGAPLANPGFETISAGRPADWDHAGSALFAVDSTVAHSGSDSAEISTTGSFAAWYQIVNTGLVYPGYQLQATAWAKGSMSKGSSNVAIAWFNTAGAFLSNTTSAPLPKDASNWTELGVNSSAPIDAAYAMVYLQCSGGAGTVWFDDVGITLVGRGTPPALAY